MQVKAVNTQNFHGSFSQKAIGFAKNQGHHIWTQSISFLVCSKIYPIEDFSQFIRAKILIDLGEYMSNFVIKNPNTTSRQCTNVFSAMTDCSKDLVRWTGKLIDKIKN